MTEISNKEFNKKNRKVILTFIENSEKRDDDDIYNSLLATITQFLLGFYVALDKKTQGQEWITTDQVLAIQIEQIRQCVIELELRKEYLTQGVTYQ